MAKKTNKGVYGLNTEIRNAQLSRNAGKYVMYKEPMAPAIGDLADVHEHVGMLPERMGEGGLLEHTISNDSKLGYGLNQHYWRNPEEIEIYRVPLVSGEEMMPYRGQYNDYLAYMKEIGHPSIIRGFINRLAGWNAGIATLSSLTSLAKHNTDIYDTLYNLNTYSSMKLALEAERPGIVEHFSVATALDGAVITNINNDSGKDTRLGEITSHIVGKTFQRAYQFNSTRNTHYITDYLRSVYGLNAQTVHNFSYLLNVDDSTGRLPEIDSNSYIYKINDEYNDWDDYLSRGIKEHSEYDTDYNRFTNIFYGLREQYKEYVDEHKLYDPFNQYLKYEIINGKSITNPVYTGWRSDREVQRRGEGEVVDGTIIHAYNEGDRLGSANFIKDRTVDGEVYGGLDEIYYGVDEDSLLYKTNKLFKDRKIGSLVGRFHTSQDTDSTHTEASTTQSSFTKFGMSHGRNLLTKKAYEGDKEDIVNDYSNPYCRVWTYHHQYHRLKDAIRPFQNDDGTSLDTGSLQENWGVGLRTADGARRLSEHTVLNPNGYVNIAPTKGADGVDITKCMFSIENLAWKDVNKKYYMNNIDQVLSPEQIGPNGGRIMWFPPYDLHFNEGVSAEWNEERFLGRGEPVMVYTNTKRTGTLSFTMLVDHPSIVDSWRKGKGEATEDDEQELLRFFAGCGLLEPGVLSPFSSPDDKDNNKEREGSLDFNLIPDPSVKGKIVFYVFFPNNYSGYNDIANEAIEYLLRGNNNLLPISTSPLQGYEMNGTGITNTGYLETSGEMWGYRVDDKYNKQILDAGNYEDTASFHLNANVVNVKACSGFGDANFSLAEFYLATNKNTSAAMKEYFYSCGASRKNVEQLERILSYGEIEEIYVDGGASKHGYKNINENLLGPDRARTTQTWVKNMLREKGKEIQIRLTNTSPVSNHNVSSKDAKLGRYAKVEIRYSGKESEVAKIDGLNSFARDVYSQSIENNNLREKYQGLSTTDLSDAFNAAMNAGRTTKEALKRAVIDGDVSGIKQISRWVKETALGPSNNGNGNRYDYEQDYFSNLKLNEPVMHHRLVDKIKYFDPAFHSITPEGFNARLTFLHQCTRQGHTVSATEKSGWSKAAGNLAFGRPPVCVLRIGDFYHTKIAITSLDIQYDDGGVQWDLNPEGIGLQPMMAKVSLNIVFLGGSDLGAPVSRLQNAVSFNYYANTSVYDNRSDVMGYNQATHMPQYEKPQWIPTPNVRSKEKKQ